MSKDLEAEPMLFLDEYTELARTRTDLINAKPAESHDGEVFVHIRLTDGYTYPAPEYCNVVTEDGEKCTFPKHHSFECSFDADVPLSLIVVKPRQVDPTTVPFIINGDGWEGLTACLEDLEAPSAGGACPECGSKLYNHASGDLYCTGCKFTHEVL